MSLLNQAKMPSLKEKIDEKAKSSVEEAPKPKRVKKVLGKKK